MGLKNLKILLSEFYICETSVMRCFIVSLAGKLRTVLAIRELWCVDGKF